jgi:tetraacyldisaccharide 4'-kinase
VEALHGRRVVAASGIANPEAFHRTLAGAGADVRERLVFPDHHPFDAEDCRRIGEAAAAADAEWIVITEKDAVRLPRDWQPGRSVLALEIVIRITQGAERMAAVLGVPAEILAHG